MIDPRFLRLRLAALALVCSLGSPLALRSAPGAAENPPAPGFDAAGSDVQAMTIADRAMEAMGGRAQWDATRYLAWRFFGMRTHVWDKWTGDLRHEAGDTLVLMNINTHRGRVWKAGAPLAGADLEQQLKTGYEAWVNDSYWLLMPYKLKDSGVTLKYLGEGKLEDGRAADIIQLTFKDVGVTPQNKYHVFAAKDSGMVEQWSFFPTADLEQPRFTTPWADWRRYGKVMLSSGRGGGRFANAISEIRVFDDLPRSVFEDPGPAQLP